MKNKIIYALLLVIILMAFSIYNNVISMEINIYDYFIEIINVPIINFLWMPIFICITLIYLLSGFSGGYAVTRNKNRKNYYLETISRLFILSIIFLFIIYCTFSAFSFLTLDRTNVWSEGYKQVNRTTKFFSVVEIKPLSVLFVNASLLGLLFFSLSLFLFNLYLKFKNIMKVAVGSFVFIVLFAITWVINGKFLNYVAFYIYLDVDKFIKKYDVTGPLEVGYVYIYWIIIIVVLLFWGLRLVKKEDLLSNQDKE